jgi:hypothetical protein
MLVKEFKRLSIMQEKKTGKELTIIMENCAGQNKNRMVLQLANYLVEANYFEKVSFVFYIVGHTKNGCDRWFNTLKKNYCRRNIYSFNQLINSMKTNPNINVTITKEEDFKDQFTKNLLVEQHTRHTSSLQRKRTRQHFFFVMMTFLRLRKPPKTC